MKQPYGDEEKNYIIRRNMGMSHGQYEVSPGFSWSCGYLFSINV